MKLLFFQWNAFMQRGIERAMKTLDIAYDVFHYIFKDWDQDDEFMETFTQVLKKGGYDTVFSVNFAPLIAVVCNEYHIQYVAWVYDCPLHIRREDTIGLPYNKVWFFDRCQVQQYQDRGMTNVFHLPLAADPEVFRTALGAGGEHYGCDVSLVGQLYQSDFAYLCTPLDGYARGFLEGLVGAQMQLSGGYVLSEVLDAERMEQLNEQYRRASDGKFSVLPEELAYTLACEATGRMRMTALALLQERCSVRLYSNDTNDKHEILRNVEYMGYVDYYSGMPQAFAESRINLNISLSAIQSGIPLRVLDIMSCGGFVISNLQPELLEWFQPDYDIVIYEDLKDLVAKTAWYLSHEKERRLVAKRGYDKVKEAFSFTDRVRKMLL